MSTSSELGGSGIDPYEDDVLWDGICDSCGALIPDGPQENMCDQCYAKALQR